jgi:hypothetical protein
MDWTRIFSPRRNNGDADSADDADFHGFSRFRVDKDLILSPLVEKQVNSEAGKSVKIRVPIIPTRGKNPCPIHLIRVPFKPHNPLYPFTNLPENTPCSVLKVTK